MTTPNEALAEAKVALSGLLRVSALAAEPTLNRALLIFAAAVRAQVAREERQRIRDDISALSGDYLNAPEGGRGVPSLADRKLIMRGLHEAWLAAGSVVPAEPAYCDHIYGAELFGRCLNCGHRDVPAPSQLVTCEHGWQSWHNVHKDDGTSYRCPGPDRDACWAEEIHDKHSPRPAEPADEVEYAGCGDCMGTCGGPIGGSTSCKAPKWGAEWLGTDQYEPLPGPSQGKKK